MTTSTLIAVEESGEDRFRNIVLSCAEAIDAALAIFLETEDEAGPHKARVALRRLTTALDAFAPILRRKPSLVLRARAKWLFQELGLVRDSDVHLLEYQGKTVTKAMIAKNRLLREKTRRKLRKRRAVDFTQRLRRSVLGSDNIFRRSAKAQRRRASPVSTFAAPVLDAAWLRCQAYGASVKAIPEGKRHEFRKDMKALRYLAEFFADLYPGLGDEPFRSDFRDIQDALGVLNDHAVSLAISGSKPSGPLPDRVSAALDQSEQLWARLASARPPWQDQPTRRP